MQRLSLFLPLTLLITVFTFTAHGQQPDMPPPPSIKVSPQNLPDTLQVRLFARLHNDDTPFRFDIKPDSDNDIQGYFPADTIVQIRYWSNPWVLVEFADMLGWVENIHIQTLITPDSLHWQPQSKE